MDSLEKEARLVKKNLWERQKSLNLENHPSKNSTIVRNTPLSKTGSDQDLLEEFSVSYDGEILNVLLNRYDRYIVGIAWPILKHQEEVKDLKQDLYIKLNNKLRTHKPSGTFRVWLGRVERNQ